MKMAGQEVSYVLIGVTEVFSLRHLIYACYCHAHGAAHSSNSCSLVLESGVSWEGFIAPDTDHEAAQTQYAPGPVNEAGRRRDVAN